MFMAPLSSSSLVLTGDLMVSLHNSRSMLDAWADDQMEQADAAAAAHEARVSQEQACIDSQIQELLAVELERGLNLNIPASNENSNNISNTSESLAKRRAELDREQDDLRKEISELQEKHSKREKEIQEFKLLEKKERARADEATDMKQRVEEAKQTTVDDLTRGIVNYKFLGLDFQKAHDNRLKFTFTQLDAGDPARSFSFVLNVNDEDTYEVEDPFPPLDSIILHELVEKLNETDDLSVFCRGMRNAFCSTL